MKFSEEQIDILRETSMVDILADLGYDTRRCANGLYLSPFRNEKNGSFHINDAKHVWCDHGGYDPKTKSGKPGGDTIDLVMALQGCSFIDALNYLYKFNPGLTPLSQEERYHRESTNKPSSVTIVKDEELHSRDLINYGVIDRRIPVEYLKAYCREVTYRINEGRELRAIGFPNMAGGWALRNAMKTGLNKFCSKGEVTVIDRDGVFRDDDITPSSDKVAIFEGFFDFLSWMVWNGITSPGVDVVVLNSTGNIKHIVDYISHHTGIASFLDNDKAGHEATEYMADYCAKVSESKYITIRILDNSKVFKAGADLNDTWVAACRKAEVARFVEQQEESTGKHL